MGATWTFRGIRSYYRSAHAGAPRACPMSSRTRSMTNGRCVPMSVRPAAACIHTQSSSAIQPLAQSLLVARADHNRLLEQFLLDVLRQSAPHVDYGLAQQMRHELTIVVHVVSLVPGERGHRRACAGK